MSDQAAQESTPPWDSNAGEDIPSWDADAKEDASQNSGAEENPQAEDLNPSPLSQDVGDAERQTDVARLIQLMHRGNSFTGLLIHDRKFIHGFTEKAIMSLGGHNETGLQITFQLLAGPLSPNCLHVDVAIRGRRQARNILRIDVPLASSKISAHAFSTGDEQQQLESLHPRENILRPIDDAEKKLSNWSAPFTDPYSPHWLWHANRNVIRLRITARAIGHGVSVNEEFFATERQDPEEEIIQRSFQNLIDHTEQQTQSQTWEFLFAATQKWQQEEWHFELNNIEDSPYAGFLPKDNPEDLDYDSLLLGVVPRPLKPCPPVYRFSDELQYIATQVVANRDAIGKLEMQQRAWLKGGATHCILFPVPNTEWASQDDDGDVYGMTADGLPTRYLGVIAADNTRKSIMPDVGQTADIYFDFLQTAQTPPTNVTDEAYRNKLVLLIFQTIKSICAKAQTVVDNKRRAFLNEQRKSGSNTYDDNGKAELLSDDEILEDFSEHEVATEYYEEEASKFLYEYVGVADITEDMRKTHPSAKVNELRKLAALSVARALYPTLQDEEWKAHIKAVISACHPPPIAVDLPAHGMPWRAQFINWPKTSLALFIVHRPLQTTWPSVFKRPFIRASIPTLQTFDDLDGVEEMLTNLPTADASPLPKLVVFADIDEKTAKMTCNGINRFLSVAKDAPQRSIFANLLAFNQNLFPDAHRRDLWKTFPGIPLLVSQGRLDDETVRFLNTLRRSRGGLIILQGPAGSGKTEKGSIVVTAVVTGGWFPDRGYPGANPSQRIPPAVDLNMPPLTSDVVEDARNLNLPVPETAVPVTTEKSSKTRADPADINWKIVAADNAQINPATVAWVVAQNNQAQDAKLRNSGKVMIRVCTYAREINNALTQKIDNEPVFKLDGTRGVLRRILEFQNTEACQHKNLVDPAFDDDSLSNKAKRYMADNPGTFANAIEAASIRDLNPIRFKILFSQAREEVRNAFQILLQEAEIVIGTPVAMIELAQHHPHWTPALLVVDEAGRIHEPLILAIMAALRSTPTMLIGDANQFPPIDTTETGNPNIQLAGQNYKFNPYFSQARLTILTRAHKLHGSDYEFKVNYRARGTSMNFVSWIMHPGDFHIAHAKDATARQVLTTAGKSRGIEAHSALFLVDLQHAEEQPQGTSFINRSEATFALQLARHVATILRVPRFADIRDKVKQPRLGKILILCMYKQQFQLVRTLAQKMNSFIMPPGLLDIRTVDDSAGCQAETVILLQTRSSRIGFTDQKERLTVALTRCIYLQYVITNSGLVTRVDGWFGQLYQFALDMNTFIQVKGHKKSGHSLCLKCGRFGHQAKFCNIPSFCEPCQKARNKSYKNHTVFACPHWEANAALVSPLSILAQDKHKDYIGLPQDPFVSY